VEIEIENNLYVDTGEISEGIKGKEEILNEILTQILNIPEEKQEYYRNIMRYIENIAEEIKSIDDFENLLENYID